MKYVVVLCDGMADYPVPELNGKTPMMCAKKPNMDWLAENGEVGLVRTVAEGLIPGSDVANLTAMGYDPRVCYTGRSPLEAVSMGIRLQKTDVTVRCNLVTLSEESRFEDKTMLDYCADDISTAEAKQLMEALEEKLGNACFHFYPGVSYRHCLVWKNGSLNLGELTPPHDFSEKGVREFLPAAPDAAPLVELMKNACAILQNHPVNLRRVKEGRKPANGIWLWGQGSRPQIESFEEKYHIRGSVVSAVDLIKGIGICAGMHACDVPGATGYIDTNFEGKVQAALNELENGQELVYIHLEATDECGHRHEVTNKVRALEYIDARVLAPLRQGLLKYGDYSMMVLPDHPTPLTTRKHANDPVPYLIYRTDGKAKSGLSTFTEQTASSTGVFRAEGHMLMDYFLHSVQ